MKRIGETQLNSFGSEIIITKYRKAIDIDVYFPEYDWTAEHVRYGDFKNGEVKCPYEPRVYGIGYIGEGKYKSAENRKPTRIYSTWTGMIKRCYSSKYQEKYPTYVGCSVCEEWLNFQNFAEWYEENYYEMPGERMNLDKDILIKGNKIYGPNTCVFVPQNINTLFTKRDAARGDLPIGVSYSKQKKKYQVRCGIGNGKENNLGLYNTPEEAFQAYKTFKEVYVKKVANDYIELIPFELYQAMIEYEVEYDD